MSANLDPGLFGIYEDLILTRNGIWLSNGEEITHERTILAFSRNLYRCKEGFEIRLGHEKKNVHVEDTIYFITRLEGDPLLGYSVTVNDGRTLELDPESLRYHRGRLTCKVPHPNENTHEEAKFLTGAYYEILQNLEKTEEGFSIRIDGKLVHFREE
jgi:hypothetical protein